MSEYQYYEFQAIDRPLTREEMSELRSCSSRARITSTRFVNEYHFGSFKGSREEWMKRYFDAHLYTSNFGSRVLSFRFPLAWIDPKTIRPYEVEGALDLIETPSHLILSFILDTEPDEYEEDEENSDILSSMLPIRSALAKGDSRALYIGWLAAMQNGLVDFNTLGPPVPPALGASDDALDSLIGFLNLREDVVAAAARSSPPETPAIRSGDIAKWLADIGGEKKDQWLSRFLTEDNPSVAHEILNHFHASARPATTGNSPARTGADLLSEADDLEAEHLERERLKAAQTERARIMALAGQEGGLWKSVIKLSESSSPNYQEKSICTLRDLRDLADMTGATSDFREKLEGFIELRQRKSTFMKRLHVAGLA